MLMLDVRKRDHSPQTTVAYTTLDSDNTRRLAASDTRDLAVAAGRHALSALRCWWLAVTRREARRLGHYCW